MPSLLDKYKEAVADATVPPNYLSNKNALLSAIETYKKISHYLHAIFVPTRNLEPTLENMRVHLEDWFENVHTIKDGSEQDLDETHGMDGTRFRFAVKAPQHLVLGETYYEIEIASDDEHWDDGRLDWCIALFQCNHSMVSSNGWDYDHCIVCDILELNKSMYPTKK